MTFKKLNTNQAKDIGLTMVLILLFIEYIKSPDWLLLSTIAVLIVVMIYPEAFRFLVKAWFGFSHFIGLIVSRIILSIIFFLIVTPVGLVRRAFGCDPMKVRLWKKGDESVLVVRNHHYSKEDIEKPY